MQISAIQIQICVNVDLMLKRLAIVYGRSAPESIRPGSIRPTYGPPQDGRFRPRCWVVPPQRWNEIKRRRAAQIQNRQWSTRCHAIAGSIARCGCKFR